jgi:hypothetical protein
MRASSARSRSSWRGAGGGVLGVGGGDLADEHDGAVVAEYVLVHEPGDGREDEFLADGHGRGGVARAGGDVAGGGAARRA